jgi:hypothetical protein
MVLQGSQDQIHELDGYVPQSPDVHAPPCGVPCNTGDVSDSYQRYLPSEGHDHIPKYHEMMRQVRKELTRATEGSGGYPP